MRKLLLQMQVSLDGFVAGPNGEMDWITWNWDNQLNDYVASLMESIDGIVIGRKLAEGFIPYWADAASKPEPLPGSEKITSTSKHVFSRSEGVKSWPRTTVHHADLATEINALKQQPGANLITYGGADFAGSLIAAQLVDEFHLFVNPAILGQGMPIFNKLQSKSDLSLLRSTAFDCGIVVLHYQLK